MKMMRREKVTKERIYKDKNSSYENKKGCEVGENGRQENTDTRKNSLGNGSITHQNQ